MSQERVTLTREQFNQLLEQGQSIKARSKEDELELIEAQAKANAKASREAEEKENLRAPGISIFSRPEGEKANPKGDLKCPFTWAGFPVKTNTLTAEEFDLINELQPGTYACQKSDGTLFTVEVTGERDVDGKLSRMDALFSTRGDARHNLTPMAVMLREMVQAAKTKTASEPASVA